MPRVTLVFWKDGKARLRVHARRTRPLRSTLQTICTRLGLQASQVRFRYGELSGPTLELYDTPDDFGLQDQDVIVVEEMIEEDDDLDEIDGTRSRFPAGFLPMRMCRWFPTGDC